MSSYGSERKTAKKTAKNCSRMYVRDILSTRPLLFKAMWGLFFVE
jgi:hypothetical protein